MRRALLFVLFVAFIAACVGCRDEVPREAVRGSVTLDGKPLETGSILFTPLGEGPSAGGEVKNGQYSLGRDIGPSPGEYRVSISAWRFVGPEIFDEATGGASREPISIVPARYNAHSELAVTVAVGEPNQFDFSLDSN